jgi:hypothetical protein
MNDQGDLIPPAQPDPSPDWMVPSNPVPPADGIPPGAPVPPAPVYAGPSQPATTSWWARYRRFAIPGAATAVVVAAAAGALLLVFNAKPSVERMVPASVDVYGMASLDPSVSQKLNLLSTIHRFPDTSSDQKIAQKLDEALKDSGLSYSGDIQPWLGSQLAFVVKIPSGNATAPFAVLAVSKDDNKAKAFLASARSGSFSARAKKSTGVAQPSYSWSDKSYDGITIAVGAPKTGNMSAAYAIVDHVVVIANSEALIHEIIDTDHGRAARLIDASQYKATLSQLPSDRLAIVYANGSSIMAHLKDQLKSPALTGLDALKLAEADAFQGAALVISARPDGVVADMTVRLDASKLSAPTREAMLRPGQPDKVISWIPGSTDGFFAFANLNKTIQSLLDQETGNPSVQAATDEIGLTGPHGVLPHLTGDFAFEAEVNHSFIPAGAVLIGTNDAAGMRTFINGIVSLAVEGQGSELFPSSSTYRGVTISTLTVPQLSLNGAFAISFAVFDGMGVVASNPAELKAIIDAHKNGTGINHDAGYLAASRASLQHPASVLYLDLARIVSTMQSAPASSMVGGLQTKAGDNLTPLKAIILTSSSSQDGMLERLIVFVK